LEASISVRCVVADDHPALRKAVVDFLLSEGFEVVGEARDGDEAVEQIDALSPTIAVVDVAMPHLSGIEVARRVGSRTAIVLYTAHGEEALLSEAFDAGARAFVLKEAPLTDLRRAIETVLAGGTYVDAVLAGAVAMSAATATHTELTKREREVLRLLADGNSNEQIGMVLFISPETVRTHVRKAMRRLEANTRTQAVATALRQSLIA
jgi:DNA-binding NarL/FixJ family response regulator